MAFKSYRDASKDNWGVTDSTTVDPERVKMGPDQIKAGALQRIADATELMAKNYLKLQSDYEYMRRDRDQYMEWFKSEQNRSRTLRGVITKLKKKLNQK